MRFLRAWAWLRWRVRINAIERGGRADTIQRFTRATEVVGPVLIGLMLVPTALVAAGLGLATGYGLASGATWVEPLVHVLRIALVAVLLLTIVGPVALPSGRGLSSLPRLLLLPVPRSALFAGEIVGGLAEPWLLAAGLAALLAIAGALAAANLLVTLAAAVAALLLVAMLTGMGTLFGALLHVLMSNRRRGEWLLVGSLTAITLLSMLPMLMTTGGGTRAEREAREREIETRIATNLEEPGAGWLALLPTELYVAVLARAAGMSPGSVLPPVAGLAGASVASLGAGWLLWQRAVDAGAAPTARSRARGGWRTTSTVSSASRGLAFTFIHHVARTARGRALVLPSVLMSLVFAAMVAFRGGMDLGFAAIRDGYAVAVFGAFVGLLSPVQLWFNQFAIDRAGLTLLCLQPVTSNAILRGKMRGAAATTAALAAVPVAAGLAIGSDLSPAYWAVLVLGAMASFLVLAPLAALLSTFFPRHVDLGSIGHRSNAHPIPALLGGLLLFASAAPSFGAAIVGFRLMQNAWVAVALAGTWLLVAAALHAGLSRLAVRAFDSRREALIAVAGGR